MYLGPPCHGYALNCHLVYLAIPGTRGTDKSPLGQKPTRTKAHWTISHWTKAHCLIWQGGQKPTSLKKIGLSLL